MLTSGLVSLNIHDSLTFDGTEIVLHPDIFNPDAASIQSFATTLAGSTRLVGSKDSRIPIAPTSSSEDKSGGPLQEGDLIEIRVWDALPRPASSSAGSIVGNEPASMALRRRTSPPIIPAGNNNISSQGSTSGSIHTQQDRISSASAPILRDAIQQASEAAAATIATNFSDDTTTHHEDGQSKDTGDTSSEKTQTVHNEEMSTTPQPSPKTKSDDNLLAKTVVTAGELPPVFPRSRTNTVDAPAAPAATTTALPPKAPVSRRTAVQPDVFAAPRTPRSSSNLANNNATTSAPRSRHFRDLSDMTIDTLYDKTSTALDTAHQVLDILPSPSGLVGAASDEDEEEDNHTWATQLSQTHTERLSLVMLVTEKSLTSLKGSARTQVSILRPIADLYNLSSYDMVTIRKIEKEEEADALRDCSADFVLVSIKDQFISRGDMYFFQKSLIGSWVYEGQRLQETSRGIQAFAREIRHQDRGAYSGIITENTKITFRSRSARFIWLVQMSAEMWDYASPYGNGNSENVCETYFDRWISFLHDLFEKWKELEVTHSLTVVFFSRTFIGSGPPLLRPKDIGKSEHTDVYGRQYEDHFRIVIENETRADWDSLVVLLKEAFVKYPSEVGWNLSTGDDARRPSWASQGNVLEATNVTLNLLQFHYLDRDLHRTGNSIVLVSAGNGVFEVEKGLASITYQRMIDCGIGSDMLSLTLPPLHTAPFFLYVNDYQPEEEAVDFGGTYYEVPHWMHLSFISYDSDPTVLGGIATKKEKENVSLGIMDIDGRQVMPNGFLMPDVTAYSEGNEASERSPRLHSVPFLQRRNTMFSVSSKKARSHAHVQGRQLIAGRNFDDILDACRPRHSGTLPSALEALLKMYNCTVQDDNDGEQKALEELKDAGGYVPELPEWGSVEFDSTSDSPMRHSRTVALGQEPAIELSPRFDPTPAALKVDEIDKLDLAAERSSVSSSYASQYSSTLGVSYDRPFLATRASPTLTGIQVQKAPSLEMNFIDDKDDEDGLSDASTETSGLDAGVEKKREDRLVESMRKIMREYDSKALQMSSPLIQPLSEKSLGRFDSDGQTSSSVFQKSQPRLNTQSSRSGSQSGGIGAALTQYRSSSNPSLDNADGEDAFAKYARAPSNTGPGTSTSSRFQQAEMGSRGISPLLLPPVTMASSDVGLSSFGKVGGGSYRRTFEQRLVHPMEVSRGGSESFGRLTSTRTYGQLSKSPPASGTDSIGRGLSGVLGQLSRSPPVGEPMNRLGSRNISQLSKSPSRASSMTASSALDDISSQGGRRRTRERQNTRPRSKSRSRRKKAFNPFRQEDEDEVLAKKSHNRRRWSHVFPLGEIEFKRRPGPNWKSLSSPAILPLSIDYFPSRQEVDHNYTFSIYNITLSEFENTPYSSSKDFLMEMVRQRLTQDFQVVPLSFVDPKFFDRTSLRDSLANRALVASRTDTDDGAECIRKVLSMGYRLQILTYDPAIDTIEVTRYDAKSTRQASQASTFQYHYNCYCRETQQYSKVVQTFTKYGDPYNWNKVDRIICGDEDREMREGMRFKRVMFALIPDKFESVEKEEEYIAKFLRLLEYLNKLRDKDDGDSSSLKVRIVSSKDKEKAESGPVESTPGISRESMQRFYVRLRKGKGDPWEWMEVVIDTTCDTSWSYRIMFHWLVAGSGKVEAQIQLLQRRCSQFGLNIVPFPQISVSKNVYLSPFRAPAIFAIRDKEKVLMLDKELLDLDYVHDGVFFSDARSVKECIKGGEDFDFGKRWSRPTAGRQFVHRSGTLFVRILPDLNGLAIVAIIGNYLYMSREPKLRGVAKHVFNELSQKIQSLIDRNLKLERLPFVPSQTDEGGDKTKSPMSK